MTPKELSPGDGMRISRRRFGRQAAIAAALSISPAKLLGTTQDSSQETIAVANRQEHSAGGGATEQIPEVEAKLANIVRKFGDRLSTQQRDHLRRILAYNEKMLASVKTFSLQNGDPPASVLKLSLRQETESNRPARDRSRRRESKEGKS